MSSKAISKVQDDIKNMKQLLSVSASGLQRQGLAIDKLKLETAQVKKKKKKIQTDKCNLDCSRVQQQDTTQCDMVDSHTAKSVVFSLYFRN